MWSSGTFLIPGGLALPSGEMRLRMAGESSRSSASRRAAVPRKSGLAKLDHLPREPTVGTRRIRVAGVRRHRSADQRRFAQSYRLLDHVLEDVAIAHVPQFLEHVASEDGAAVIERREQTQHAKSRVE